MIGSNIFDNLYSLYRENKFSHAYLIETDNVQKCYEDVITLIKKINCTGEYSENCDKCNLCHLIQNGSLPSLKVINTLNNSIKKDAVDELKRAFTMAPTFTSNNFYIINECDKMNDFAYNKMLKFLEEPNDNIIGFYITSNFSQMPATIVSRLEHLKHFYYDKQEYDENIYKLATEYYELLKQDINKVLWYNKSVLEKEMSERSEYVVFLQILFDLSHQDNNLKISKLITKYLDEINYNINLSLMMDSLAIEFGEVYGK